MTAQRLTPPVLLALALSMAAAVSLGITRFAYGLLLPIMRDDLGWSYTLAGAMNTANALGYLVGALSAPALLRRRGASAAVLVAAVGAQRHRQRRPAGAKPVLPRRG
jgi:predicted MFS family arabinose efflux permease